MPKTYFVIKRIFDVVAAFFATVFFLLPWAVIALIIKVQSPGPVIFKARRVGKDGKVFTLYKFRTMRVDSGDIRATTLRNDSRVFRFGRFLRISKLDETPQLINILQGHMSIIGPRPEDEENAARIYTGKFSRILAATPGLSSPASLYDYAVGERYETEERYINEFLPKKLAVELYYVEHRALWYDFFLIFRTVVMIAGVILKKNVKIPWEAEKALNQSEKRSINVI